jgi:HAD superfamily hydrolase (TIGR01509 family)
MIAAVIFDFDGVILDSETPEYESHRRVYEHCGATLTDEEWCTQIGTWSEGLGDRWHKTLCERSAQALDRESFERERTRIFRQILPREPMRGIRTLLEQLADAGVPRAIASSAPARWVVAAVADLGLSPLFAAIVTGDDVERRKPAPDAYLEAARRLGVDPARSIAIEDSGPGVAAARAAGLKTVAIPHWLTASHDLSAADLHAAHAGELTLARLATLMDEELQSTGPRTKMA